MKLVSLTSTSRADCFGITRSSSPRRRRPSESTTGDDDVPGHSPNVALCNNLLQSATELGTLGPRPAESSSPSCSLDQAVDLAAVGAALGLRHHGADDGADRLAVAGADLLGGLGVGGDRGWRRSPPARRRRPTSGPRPSRSTIAAGSPPSATRAASTVLPLPWEIFFSPTIADQGGQRLRRRPWSRRRRVLASAWRSAAASSPVTQLATTFGSTPSAAAAVRSK